MALFAYEARTSSGEVRRGEVEAPSKNDARNRLRQMSLNPTSVKKKGGSLLDMELQAPSFMKPKILNKDLVIFTRQFATMIDSGLPLVQCLEIQAAQAPNPTLREQLAVVKESVESGVTFADSLKKFPDTFDELFRNLVAAGEIGGILDTILNRLAVFLEKNDKLKRQIKGAMTYPVVVLFVAIIVTAVLLLKVVPSFDKMFADFGGTLPGPTQLVINMSYWLQSNGLYLFGGVVAFVMGFRMFKKTSKGEYLWHAFILKLPKVGDLVTKVAVARFCRTLGTMVSSGVPILDGLDICSRTAGNRVIENAVLKAKDSISEGRNISEPLMESGVFPEMVCQMISVGENTGALDIMLNKIADFYEDEVDQAVENLTAMIEPIIMVFLGGVVGGFIIAMYLPIFSMANQIQ
ncbi:MAG: type II secretion system F family protein [Myxococcota bacterium]|nr:type II secretion system F family protein [Myxococcota bacterium]